mmetsp:Transcript_24847/g.60251  ORF Transcript_24847/g.60251 Transcript_24847/m.60251 type:complete len:395 (-) Transcript_24847:1664-2848(-)
MTSPVAVRIEPRLAIGSLPPPQDQVVPRRRNRPQERNLGHELAVDQALDREGPNPEGYREVPMVNLDIPGEVLHLVCVEAAIVVNRLLELAAESDIDPHPLPVFGHAVVPQLTPPVTIIPGRRCRRYGAPVSASRLRPVVLGRGWRRLNGPILAVIVVALLQNLRLVRAVSEAKRALVLCLGEDPLHPVPRKVDLLVHKGYEALLLRLAAEGAVCGCFRVLAEVWVRLLVAKVPRTVVPVRIMPLLVVHRAILDRVAQRRRNGRSAGASRPQRRHLRRRHVVVCASGSLVHPEVVHLHLCTMRVSRILPPKRHLLVGAIAVSRRDRAPKRARPRQCAVQVVVDLVRGLCQHKGHVTPDLLSVWFVAILNEMPWVLVVRSALCVADIYPVCFDHE